MNERMRRWPVIEDLPLDEQKAFEDWIAGSQMPLNADGSQGHYQHDYDRWKRSLQRNNRQASITQLGRNPS